MGISTRVGLLAGSPSVRFYASESGGLNLGGFIVMAVSVGTILILVAWCYHRLLRENSTNEEGGNDSARER